MSSASPSIATRDYFLRQTVTPYTTLASLYDSLLGDRFVPPLLRAFEWFVQQYSIRFASAADVACGTGTFVQYLRRLGTPVVYGVDRSPEMLHMAIAKNQGSGARFLLQDFARLQPPQRVDLITCHFDSLNYLQTTDELSRVFCRFNANLNFTGHLIFDMITDRPVWHCLGPRAESAIVSGATVVRVRRWDPRRGIQKTIVSISRNGRSYQETHVQRGYPVPAVVGLLAQAGLALLGAHDFRTLGSVTRRTRRVAYVAWKRDRSLGFDYGKGRGRVIIGFG
jgi:SAM-dependent methyltransferase